MIICFNCAPFEGFKSDVFRLIWAASVVWILVCFFSFPLTRSFPPFSLFPSLPFSLAVNLCRRTVVPLPLSVSWPTGPSGWPLELSVGAANITGGALPSRLPVTFFSFFGHPCFEVLKVSFPGSRECQRVSVSTSITSLLNNHVATTESTPPWGGLCPGWWQLYGSNMNKILHYLNCWSFISYSYSNVSGNARKSF